MTSQKFITSISTIPNDSRLYSTTRYMNSSTTDLKFPYSETLPLKFPKHPIRKQTKLNTHTETNENPQRSCIRNYAHANQSRIFDPVEPARRLAKFGAFHSLSRESVTVQPLNRSVEDLGIPGNRRRFVEARHIKPDPIVVGQPSTKHNSALERVWAEPRRHRDNGRLAEEALTWKTQKPKGYLDRYREKVHYKQESAKNTRFSIIS